MQQKNKSNYLEVISMEEYLTKRQKIREKEQKKVQRRMEKDESSIITFTSNRVFSILY